jgi:pimeloyl-ACP methyl ester carboxylesterase
MRAFNPQLRLLRKLVNQFKIPVNLLFGEYDKIITTSQGLAFKKQEPLISIRVLKCGHQILKEKYVEDVAALLGK